MLEIENLKVVRGSFSVTLPSLKINDGQCVALCGVSGSGKSTLMEAIGLLSPAYSLDSYVLDNVEIDVLEPQEQLAGRVSAIGIMPQVGGLLPYLTVRENIELQIKLALKQQTVPVYPKIDAQTSAAIASLSASNKWSAKATKALDEAFDSADGSSHMAQALVAAAHEVNSAASAYGSDIEAKKDKRLDKAVQELALAMDSYDAPAAKQLIAQERKEAQERALAKVKGVELKPSQEKLVSKIKEALRAKKLRVYNKCTKKNVQSYFSALEPYIETLELTHLLDLLPEQLSIGQRQRALFLRAIAHKPRLLLIDEPTSALDPDNAYRLFSLIDKIAHESHICVLIITHDLNAASRYTCYAYDEKNSHADHSVFSLVEKQQEASGDYDFLSGVSVDWPSATNINNDLEALYHQVKDQQVQELKEHKAMLEAKQHQARVEAAVDPLTSYSSMASLSYSSQQQALNSQGDSDSEQNGKSNDNNVHDDKLRSSLDKDQLAVGRSRDVGEVFYSSPVDDPYAGLITAYNNDKAFNKETNLAAKQSNSSDAVSKSQDDKGSKRHPPRLSKYDVKVTIYRTPLEKLSAKHQKTIQQETLMEAQYEMQVAQQDDAPKRNKPEFNVSPVLTEDDGASSIYIGPAHVPVSEYASAQYEAMGSDTQVSTDTFAMDDEQESLKSKDSSSRQQEQSCCLAQL